nr:BREX-1 system adenine-specific DNA-methyltransferase PglX [Blautia caecimuris]
MNKTAIKNFAIWARNKLIADVSYDARLIGITEDGIAKPLPQSFGDTQFFDIGTAEPYSISGEAVRQRDKLIEVIQQKEKDTDYKTAYQYVIEEVAYTWFNRLIAIRFMEVNDYLPSHIRVLSSESGKLEPDLVTTPFDAELPFTAEEETQIFQLKQDNKLDEVFRILFLKQCNALNEILPALFEKTKNYTELLLNLSVTNQDGVIYHLIHDIPEDDFNVKESGQIEIVGWLYQYYISQKHEEVVDILDKGTVKKEDVAAATQLFTTDWVVRYMVDNSLGRYWLERKPESKLREKMEFFAKNKDGSVPTVNEKIEPTELTIFDPCMGSGHILVYAFDLLMDVYEECGYTQRDAAALIVKNNIFGVDIDKRATQLAYFAIMMKARQYDRRFFTRNVSPNLYCTENYPEGELLGSLIIVDHLEEEPVVPEELTLFNMDYEHKKSIWNLRRVLSQKYTAVCTNPPYLNKYNPELKDYVQKQYKDYSGDLFSVFMYRNFDFCTSGGYSAFMTPFVWMFIKTYEKLRDYIIDNKSITTLVQMEYSAYEEATVPICTFVLKNRTSDNKSLCFKLSDFKGGMEVQKIKVVQAIKNPECGYFYEASANDFKRIKGHPIAFWASEEMLNAFENYPTISEIAPPKQGLATANNDLYLKLWFEPLFSKIGMGMHNCSEAQKSGYKWFPYNKGGAFRRWYGNRDYVVNWENDGEEIKNFKDEHGKIRSRPQNTAYYFRQGITWSDITSASFSGRFTEAGFIFDIKGSSGFPNNSEIYYVLGFLNSSVSQKCIKILNPTITTQVGDMSRIPVEVKGDYKESVDSKVEDAIQLSQRDWDSFETSWDYKKHPLLRNVSRISEAFIQWQAECDDRFNRLKANEEELNRIFIDIYGLQEELTPEVEDKDVTVRKADLQRDIKSLLSYAVGCMFGRYSLDVEGLAYAGGEWDSSKYQSYIPDADNVIPITDEEYLDDDIVSRLCAWLKAVYGADTLEANLDYIAKALGNKGSTSREIIRNYFLNDFFKDHCQTYSVTGSGKRPIYWLFDSGKQNGFKALVYLHRYTPDTIGNLRIDYLHKMQRVYESEINRMQDMMDHSENAREVAAASKRKDKLAKQLKECREYDEKISHLALSRIELDLDDGVKVNYRKLQTAQDGKFYEVLADSKNIMVKEKK